MNGDQGPLGPIMRHPETFGYGSGMHDGGTSSLEWAILGIVIAILVVVLLLLVDHCRQRRRHRRQGWSHHGASSDEPLAIVRSRYARGEMTRDEYLQSLGDLGAAPEGGETPPATEPEKKPRRRRERS